MKKIVNRLTGYLLENEIIEISETDKFLYGFEITIGQFIINTILFLISLSINKSIHTLLFMLVFFSLRGRTGGFHLNSRLFCFMATIGICSFILLWYAPLIERSVFCFICNSVFAFLCIFFLAPLNHPNLSLCKREIKVCRFLSRVLFCFWMLSACILRKNNSEYSSYISAGIGIDAILLFLGKIFRQEVKMDG